MLEEAILRSIREQRGSGSSDGNRDAGNSGNSNGNEENGPDVD